MNQILVEIIPETAPAGDVDELCTRMPELTKQWREAMEESSRTGAEVYEMPAMRISTVNSRNFQVIGMLYQVIRTFQKEHTAPGQIKILCGDEETARMYRVVYNFYMPRTKEERMADSGWD